MSKSINLACLLLIFTPVSAVADSFLRIKCYDKDLGAEVFINGKLVGNCPVDAPSPAGIVQLRARKIVNKDYEQLFEKQLHVFDGIPQKIEITLSAAQLTADAIHKNAVNEANVQLRAAEAGDTGAMKKLAEYYDSGIGVEKNSLKAQGWRKKIEITEANKQRQAAEAGDRFAMVKIATYYETGTGVDKDPSKAKFWKDKAENANAQAELAAANSGSIPAMQSISERYAAGRGINKDSSLASEWHNKAEAAKLEQSSQERAKIKQAKIDQVDFLWATHTVLNDKGANPLCSTTALPSFLLYDLTTAPTRTSELYAIKNEAALRPSTWGKPDSMIAQASRQYNSVITADKKSLLTASK